MYDFRKFYIDGAWVSPAGRRELDVINPATEQPIGKISLGTRRGRRHARSRPRARAFETFSQTIARGAHRAAREDRRGLQGAHEEMAQIAISDEMGAPMWLARTRRPRAGIGHLLTHARRC